MRASCEISARIVHEDWMQVNTPLHIWSFLCGYDRGS
jgi:hypothetical protein